MKRRLLGIFAAGLIVAPSIARADNPSAAPLTGYVVNFDFFTNEDEGLDLIRIAKHAGAQVINLVPPSHVWEHPDALAILDDLISDIGERNLKFVITRVDAAYPPDRNGEREYYLYDNILTRQGTMRDGSPSGEKFLATVGITDYDQWMEDETRYYAHRYGAQANFIGFNLGPFSEPFVAERGGFFGFDMKANRYDLTQYTPEVRALMKNIANPTRADYVKAINTWFVDRYERCRKIWHETADRKDIPFILQFSGYDQEKFDKGYPEFAGFDRQDWVNRADAIGLSVYTNSGYPDLGHESTVEMVRNIRDVWHCTKPVFVLEGGCEMPKPTFNKEEITFYANVARPLKPVTYIYEFLRDPFYAESVPNPGYLVDGNGEVRPEQFLFLKNTMKNIRNSGKSK